MLKTYYILRFLWEFILELDPSKATIRWQLLVISKFGTFLVVTLEAPKNQIPSFPLASTRMESICHPDGDWSDSCKDVCVWMPWPGRCGASWFQGLPWGWIFQLPRIRVAHSGKTNVPNLVFEVTMQWYILPPNPECFFGSICSYSVFSNGHTVNNPLVEAYTFHSFECVDFKEEREHHLWSMFPFPRSFGHVFGASNTHGFVGERLESKASQNLGGHF